MAVKQTFTSDTAQLEKAMAKIERMNTRLIEQNRKLAAGSRQASHKARSGFGGWIKGLAGVAAGYLSVRMAIQAVIRTIEDKEQRQREARDYSITVAEAQAMAIRNLGNVSGEAVDDFTRRMEKLAKETKPAGGLATIYQAASTGLSSSGADVDLTERAVRAAAKISPESAEGIDRLTQALLHLNKATGTRDAEKNLGFLLSIGQQAAVTDPAKIAQHLVPGVIGTSKYGGTATESGAILAAITQYMGDREGRKSATAGRNLAKQLAEFLPEETTYKYEKDRRGRARKVVDVEGTGLKSTMDRIKYLQEHPQARTQFLSGASFSSHADAPVKMLLGEMGLGQADPLEKILGAMPSPDEYSAQFRQQAANLARPSEQTVAAGQRGIDTTVEELQRSIGGMRDQLAGLYSDENMVKVLRASGAGWWSTFGSERMHEMKNLQGKGAGEYQMQVDLRRARLQAQGTPESIQQAQILKEHLADVARQENELKNAIREQTEQVTELLRDANRTAKRPQPAAVGANIHQHEETGAF